MATIQRLGAKQRPFKKQLLRTKREYLVMALPRAAIRNPYSKGTETERKLLDGAKREAKKQKERKEKEERKAAKRVALRSATAAASAKARNDERKLKRAQSNLAKNDNWQTRSVEIFGRIHDLLKQAVRFDDTKMTGKWPELLYAPIISPASDPMNSPFLKSPDGPLMRKDFAFPDLMIWAPEMRFPDLYPDGRPCCPFHNRTDCVEHLGWNDYIRRCYSERGNIGLLKSGYSGLPLVVNNRLLVESAHLDQRRSLATTFGAEAVGTILQIRSRRGISISSKGACVSQVALRHGNPPH